ncbi:DUF6318 family protein [Nocardioides sp. Soil777]|uniref:DUF6318 family protein n=1 Tax=Nocardioides sp. Soil777 TaxID=1736409 RepID=UPI000AEE44D0|nr:DUF6318 family protein [Nocardioides sp. Soil777]
MDPAFSGKKVFMKLGPVRRALAAACILPLLLAGCSDAAPTPEIPDPTTSSPSPDETETGPVEPTLPPEAEGDGVEAAEAFVSYYFDLLTYAQATGDTSKLSNVAIEGCETCQGSLEAVRRTYEAGGSISGGAYEVTAIRASEQGALPGGGSSFVGRVSVDHSRQVISGSKVDGLDGTYPAGTSEFDFAAVIQTSGDWQMADWTLL